MRNETVQTPEHPLSIFLLKPLPPIRYKIYVSIKLILMDYNIRLSLILSSDILNFVAFDDINYTNSIFLFFTEVLVDI